MLYCGLERSAMPTPLPPQPVRADPPGRLPHPTVGRELPAEEWDRLAGLPIAEWGPNPDTCAVAVVEVDGRIVATWAALTAVHADGCYIVPEYRGHPAVTKALITALTTLLQARGIPEVLTITQSPETDALAAKLGGVPIPGQLWKLPVGGP